MIYKLSIFIALFTFSCKDIKKSNNKKINSEAVSSVDNYECFIGDAGKVLKLQFLIDEDKVNVVFKGERFTLIQELSASGSNYKNNQYELILWHGETILKRGNKTLFKQTPQLLKGKLSLGHESHCFSPDGSNKVFWIYKRGEDLEKRYYELTKGEKPYTSIYAVLKVIDKGKAEDGFAADYDGVYEVVSVLETHVLSKTETE